MPTNKRMVLALLCILPVVAFAAGCGAERSVVVGEGSDRFLDETFADWVSFADQLSIVSVVAEEAEPPSADVLEHGEGYISRTVTLQVEKTLWRRDGAPSAQGGIRVVTDGWVLEGGELHRFAIWGGPRLEVGGRYLAPLVRAPRDGAEWTPLSAASTLPLEGDTITTAGIVGHPSAIADAMRGKASERLAEVLARTPPDAIAAKHFGLDPDARVQAVLRAD
ncbi:MAG TPA: hypothetical protein VKA57_06065 [Solirubrobacteraceae bacterium]|nr:hypothetical protein [Solirubrobacteraceae bacterium]